MSQNQQLALKPQAKLVTRLFLSNRLKQDLHILSLGSNDLALFIKDYAETNPFVSVTYPKQNHNLDWIGDSQESLIDHLLMQLAEMSLTPKQTAVVKYLILNLDHDGYFRSPLAELASQTTFAPVDLENGLEILHTFDPIGIAARDLNECLLLQAQALPTFNSVALAILNNQQLELLADPAVWKSFPWSEIELEQALAAIQKLKPIPANGYLLNNNATQFLIPDLIFTIMDGQISISKTDIFAPELVFDDNEYSALAQQASDQEKHYFLDQKTSYQQIAKSIERRTGTLLAVAKLLAKRQKQFLLTSKKSELKQIGLKELSQELDLSPSTISRAIKDKYFECRGQVFALKILLVKGISGYTQEKIQTLLREFINHENKLSPLSDDELVMEFRKIGIGLSRRVIAKYRKQLNIGNSYARKIDQN